MEIDSFHLIRSMGFIDRRKLGSAWDRGVRAYSHELLGNLFYWTMQGHYLDGIAEAEEKALDGARSWEQYSRSGLSLVSSEEIARRLCTPSELRRCKGGLRNPNPNEDWIGVQARALFQAWEMLKDAILETGGNDDNQR